MVRKEINIYDEQDLSQPNSPKSKLYDPNDPSFKDEHPQSPHSDKPQPNLTLNDGDRYRRVVFPKFN